MYIYKKYIVCAPWLFFFHVVFWILGIAVKAFASEVLMLHSMKMSEKILFVTTHGIF